MGAPSFLSALRNLKNLVGGGLVISAPVSGHSLEINRIAGEASIKAGDANFGHMIIDAPNGDIFLNNYSTTNIKLAPNGGNVGIGLGASSPAEKLEVNGNVKATKFMGDGAVSAWVNFNGTGTVAIRDSFNVSSITDTGIGNYTINFTTAMASANYAVAGFAKWDSTDAAGLVTRNSTSTQTASACDITVGQSTNGAYKDFTDVHLIAVGK